MPYFRLPAPCEARGYPLVFSYLREGSIFLSFSLISLLSSPFPSRAQEQVASDSVSCGESSRQRRFGRRSSGGPKGLGERGRVRDLQWPERDPFRGSARAEVVRRRGRGGELPVATMAGSARGRGSLAAVAEPAGEVARWRATRCGRGRTASAGAGGDVGDLGTALLCACVWMLLEIERELCWPVNSI